MTEDEKVLLASNAIMLKENEKFEKENEALSKEINLLIQRIEVSTLLKQIDLEEMRMLASNNSQMSVAFQGLLNQWEAILKDK
jgi:hypothetical protein